MKRSSLPLARLVWIILAVGYLLLWLASVPGYYERVSTLTIEPFKLGERVIYDNAIAQTEAEQRGITVQTNAVYNIIYDSIQVLVYYAVAGIILWRTTNGFGQFTAFVLMLFSTTIMSGAIGVAPTFPGAIMIIEIPAYIIWPLWMEWLALFPNGHTVPRRAFLPFSVAIALFIALQVASVLSAMGILSSQIDTVSARLGGFGALPIFGFVLISQIYRYRRVYTSVERQQAKWFLFGLGLVFLGLVITVVSPTNFRLTIFGQNIFSILFLLFPILVAVAITRYRLFDIDLIIRRTLQYTLLTGLLALAYFGGVVILQGILGPLAGSANSPIVTVITTLGIAALFTPLRRRVQDFIDRRFFRKKYNAEQALAAFAITARDEVDMDKLAAALIGVVEETMQPEKVSLWLKPTGARPDRYASQNRVRSESASQAGEQR